MTGAPIVAEKKWRERGMIGVDRVRLEGLRDRGRVRRLRFVESTEKCVMMGIEGCLVQAGRK